MPVLVTGVEGAVGRRAVHQLAAGGGEVRAFVQADLAAPARSEARAGSYRQLGCKVAHGHLDDEAHLEPALEQVHTVLHLLGRPTDDPAAHLDATATVVSAAIGAGCRRLVLLSDLAIAQVAQNPWLEALAEAEEMAADAPLESVVLRCAVIVGPDDPLTAALAAGALGDDPPGAHWPVSWIDVATTAVLADAERDLDTSLHVEASLTGPARVTTADLARRLAELVAHEPEAPAGGALPAHAADLLTRTTERPEGALISQGTPIDAGW